MRFGLAAGAGAHGKGAGDGEAALVRHIPAINRHAQIASRNIVVGVTMNGDAVYRSAELIYQGGAEQIRVTHYPGLIGVIQSTLRAGEEVARGEIIGRGPEEMTTNVAAKERVLRAGLVISTSDVLILVDVGDQSETGLTAAAGGGGQQGRQLQRRRIAEGSRNYIV